MSFVPPISKFAKIGGVLDFGPGFVDDGIPSWEKKFCSLIGSVPWRKVVDAKKYMYCHGNILNWDDSAGEEAFHNAKNRFWAEINGVSCVISPPDPNLYIDEINWNVCIDPEVIKDLEQDLFVPDEGDTDTDDVKNPWESNNNMQSSLSLIDKAKSWNQQDSDNNKCSNLNNVDNPWERGFSQESEAVKGKPWGVCVTLGSVAVKELVPSNDKGRGNLRDSSRAYNRHESKRWINSEASKDRKWEDNVSNSQGWKQWDNYGKNTKGLDFRKHGGGWETWNEGSWQREGARQHITGYKSTRIFILFSFFLLPGKQMPVLPTHITEDDRNSQHQMEQYHKLNANLPKPFPFRVVNSVLTSDCSSQVIRLSLPLKVLFGKLRISKPDEVMLDSQEMT
ncbi:hypothetical protein OIU85_025618 [Salix viminalis]|uniref:Uncharacterized protein n=1 Tax=Salix viminalis TaxID=40686 RepID=A0A9Q0YXW9_SALVM|nr:hypothetical protein OIU85_025618 [Salix viminalis]